MVKETAGMMMRELPGRWRLLGLSLMLVAALIPVALRVEATMSTVLSTPANMDLMAVRVTALEAQQQLVNRRMERDSARDERILCISEVQAGLRPKLDLTTRCAR